MKLHEKYRPRTLETFIGNEKIIKAIEALEARNGFHGDAIAFIGPSGEGKTTLARILARRFVGEGGIVEELDGSEINVKRAREISDSLRYRPLFGKGRAFIINELQAISTDSVQVFLSILERIPEDTVFFFTTTEEKTDLFGNFSNPFFSRMKCFQLSKHGQSEAFAEYVHGIAEREGLNGRPIADYMRLGTEKGWNLRAMLEAVEAGYMKPGKGE